MSSKYAGGPTETERCIESLLAVFQRYAGNDGDACSLSKREFLTFMNTELASFTKNQKDPGVVDRMMKKLDMNNDGKLDFSEFLNLIGGLAQACHVQVVSSPTSCPPRK
ncbi:protein S100-A11-like [Sphaerodactylus townsendi]|uniref:protein S100-A11-like n=1 Tax=Sphaerodactylus townsendi TaxID=933632 RepID=UPI0020260588|nr:protein S100-A11-like [Sphaerodactylus townsendi]